MAAQSVTHGARNWETGRVYTLSRRPFHDEPPTSQAADVKIRKLPPEEARLLRLRFGLQDLRHSPAEVAAALGLSLRAERLLERRALRTLRGFSLPDDVNGWDEV